MNPLHNSLQKFVSLFVTLAFTLTSLSVPVVSVNADEIVEPSPIVEATPSSPPNPEETPIPEASPQIPQSLEDDTSQNTPERPTEITEPSPVLPPKLQKRQAALKQKLDRQNLSPDKQTRFVQKLERVAKRQERTAVKNLKKQFQNERKAAQKQLQDELKAGDLTKAEKQALRENFKAENQKQLETLQQLNDAIKADFEASLTAEFSGEELALAQEVVEPEVLFALQDELPPELLAPNDTRFAEQWGLQSIGIPSAANATPPTDKKVIIALIDTGVDLTHEDLQGNFWTSETCVDDLDQPIEGGCRLGGYDFVDDDTDPSVDDGATHGTAVAGILGATTDNNVGMASASHNHTEVMVLKVAEDNLLTAENITRAIHFAINNDADIINMSFGGPTASEQMQAALALAEANDILVTAAAGNYGLDSDTTPIYPASYALSNIISVAALDNDDTLASFSNYGASSVDIAAPGVNILSTLPGNNYGLMSGTSFSAPMVAAVLAWYVLFPDGPFENEAGDDDVALLRKEEERDLSKKETA